MTKFTTIEGLSPKEKKETVFTHYVNGCSGYLEIEEETMNPYDFQNIMFIGRDLNYGDVFKAWDCDINNFTIFFGEKGDEFNKTLESS